MVEISRFAPAAFPRLARVPGVSAATASCAFKSGDQRDLLLVALRPGTAVAGVFTQSTVTSAAVQSSKRSVRGGRARALVVHSGNANALTGRHGKVLVERMCQTVGDSLGCPPDEVLMAATGIIGQRVTDEQLLGRLPDLAGDLGEVDWEQAVEAIRTTDTFSKGSTRAFTVGDRQVSVSGIAKGAGMIAPDMATMLCFLFTDAAVEPDELQRLLTYANARSFRRITVDGDESTSDTMLAFATAHTDLAAGGDRDAALGQLREALAEVAFDLAMQVVKDGEGISKLIEVTVRGARTEGDAFAMSKAIAESPLVKTAVAGGHANWGRIAMAIGKTHRPVDQDRLSVWLGPHQVVVDGDQNDELDLDALAAYMKSDSIAIAADVAMGHESSTVWTCDLTHQYIDINAYYMT
ncbi:bifunctional glutamate N-acetyltransferase/amino-acid acetyltransferase ArgJ [Actinocrinis puniceicyclus]|uniref:Arginine biosynthesis bifunctional protein ArgJ n=1 Tax=Actinocrinis puniceicyclus TaxID=977794 RepID=A0A8J8BCL6_9ACTN|nr:bifunctional glutamate N-acetyltransferase/amino-acid acetyltransferase ArgJ [Actinocrinis puniceicyclus]MBS2963246.1 bifunctional glutamate N-acetyltransferase/amino-acid acetyltransferase ArgJ [Actinocrinis puniceicyclus]